MQRRKTYTAVCLALYVLVFLHDIFPHEHVIHAAGEGICCEVLVHDTDDPDHHDLPLSHGADQYSDIYCGSHHQTLDPVFQIVAIVTPALEIESPLETKPMFAGIFTPPVLPDPFIFSEGLRAPPASLS